PLSEFTHLNLEEVEDQAPKFGMTGMEFRSARVPLECENAGMSYLRLAPNFRMPFGHHHNVQEEIYVLVGGSARLKLDDEVIDLKPFDAVRIAKETMRNFRSEERRVGKECRYRWAAEDEDKNSGRMSYVHSRH